MEPEIVELEASVKGLAVLLLIPVVLFALGAEYFIRYLEKLSIKERQHDRNAEVEKVRITGLFIILFQFTVFLAASDIREAFPFISQVIFIGVVLLQLWIQSGIETKVRPIDEKKSDNFLKLGIRAALSWLLGVSIYGAVLFTLIQAASLIADRVHANSLEGASILLFGGLIGVILGLTINFAFSAFHLKNMLPTTALEDEKLKSRLDHCFTTAGLRSPHYRMIELKEMKIAHTIMGGFHRGKGPLLPTLFIARSTFNLLTLPELEAVILNQASHIVLNHLRKRFVFSLSLILLTTLLAVISVFIGQALLVDRPTLESIGPAVALTSFFMSFKFLATQGRNHEIAADLYTVQQLGVPLDDLASALRKLDTPFFDNQSADSSGNSPKKISAPTIYSYEIERRIELVKTLLKSSSQSQIKNDQLNNDSKDTAA